ncbi:Serine/threonine-protein kinase env7 [Coemansia pectinata]|uniref:non-specific serine/threonine protein kinase n=1 Tax=Coemansia pectinata TaxID=1052879 RepID=A0A9W8LC23_9FUNG|nr:Serine/threonine-protein kinase env7 [Coemansia pectinata]
MFLHDLLGFLTDSLDSALGVCCTTVGTTKPSSVLSIGSRQYKIVRALGEGGFSHVLLVEDFSSGEQFAAKKIVCQHGMDTYSMAQREIDAYRRFRHPNIIPMVDVLDVPLNTERRPIVTVYMVFPVYKRGNLLDLVMHNQETGRRLEESFIVDVFRAISEAVRYLHTYSGPLYDNNQEEDYDNGLPAVRGYAPLQATDDYSPSHATPYAHRDIKLGNVMLADDGQTPVLMDFGSCLPARFTAHTRSDALRIQDDAAENCSMAYRAPELFDVQTGAEFDERTDVWSLGCLLYALAYSHTPFEDPVAGPAGTSIVLAAINRKYTFPEPDPYSPRLKQLIDFMLEPDPKRRPFIDQVVSLTDTLYP